MPPSNLHPKWWQLYLTFPLLIALFALDARLKISVRGHQAIQVGILLLVYGLIYMWLKANANALANTVQPKNYGRVRVIRVPLSQLADSETEERLMLELPASEIKGVLSDTFGVEYIDAEAFPVDKISEVTKKE